MSRRRPTPQHGPHAVEARPGPARSPRGSGLDSEAFADTVSSQRLYEYSLAAFRDADAKHGRFVDVNGVRMHCLEWGADNGIPLIWSHGYTSTGFELAEVGPSLASLGFHVYAISYRGHGQTQIRDHAFTLNDVADDIAAFMDQRRIERAVIGGFSLGGAVTTTFYESYPSRVLGIVLEDGGGDVVQHTIEQLYPRLLALAATQSARKEPMCSSDRYQVYRSVVNSTPLAPQLTLPIATIFQSMVVEEGGIWRYHARTDLMIPNGLAGYNPSGGAGQPLLSQSYRRVHAPIAYRNLRVPMLVIDPTGDDDVYGSMTPAFTALRAAHPALVRVVQYADTPHTAHILRPELFLRDMAQFLEVIQADREWRPAEGVVG